VWFLTVFHNLFLKSNTFPDNQFAIFTSHFLPAYWWQCSNIYLVFSTSISRPTYLITYIKMSVFLFIVSMLSLSRFTLLGKARSWFVPFNFSPTWFSWIFLMAYPKAKLKSSDDKPSPCFSLSPFYSQQRWTNSLEDITQQNHHTATAAPMEQTRQTWVPLMPTNYKFFDSASITTIWYHLSKTY
jgi:hypothetical protein